MKFFRGALCTLILFLPALASAQVIGTYPAAKSPLQGNEGMLSSQANSGCPTEGCTVEISPAQIAAYVAAQASNYGLLLNNNGVIGSVVPTATGTYSLEWTSLNAPPVLVAASSGSMTWPAAAGIPCYSGSSSWCTSYSATNAIPANYLPAALSSSTSINGTSVPASAGTLWGSTGALTVGHCADIASTAPLELTDAGAACGSGSSAFSALTGGTNTGAAMLVGTGASLGPTGTGAITANKVPTYTTAGLPASCAAGDIAYATDGNGAFTYCNNAGTWTSTGGTLFTYSIAGTGCTAGTVTKGDATGGEIPLTANPGGCSITVTFNGAVGMTAPSGIWVCSVSDPSLNGPTSWFGSWGASSYTSTTATFQIPGAAGGTDNIDFACSPH